MRLILIYKYGFSQRRAERVDIQECSSTSQIVEFLVKKLRRQDYQFILRVKKDKILLRLIPGWPIQHYELHDGSQIQIQQPERQQQESLASSNTKSKYLANLFGMMAPNQLGDSPLSKINQQQEDQSNSFAQSSRGSAVKVFDIRKYLDQKIEKILKQVQKGHMEEYTRLLQQVPNNCDDQAAQRIQVMNADIVNQLGVGGWGAIHYAVYWNRLQILKDLVSRNVNPNQCTADGWLALQIAANRRNLKILQYLLSIKHININETTSRGTALHVAVKQSYLQGVKLLISKDADFKIHDDKGRSPIDVCQSQQILSLLKVVKVQPEETNKTQQKVVGYIPPKIQIVKGILSRVRSIILTLSEKYAVLDPFEGTFIFYDSQAHYPKKPNQIIPIVSIKSVKMIKQKSWHMKSDYHYFEIYTLQRDILVCKHKNIAERWVKAIFDSMLFCQESDRNKSLKQTALKTFITLDDIQGQVIDLNALSQTPELGKRPSLPAYVKKESIFIKKNTGSLIQTAQPPPIESPLMTSSGIKLPQSPTKQDSNQQSNHTSTTEQNTNQVKSTQSKQRVDEKKQLNESLQALVSDKVNFSSFQIIKTLGSGAFGKVFLARHISSNKMYALKALKKKTLIVKKQLKYAISEANVLKKANHPFIINLYFAFQTPHFLYLALDYCPGKDLNYHLARQEMFKQPDARFYAAQLILAVQHLHQRNIIYRDMKPQNILLDAEGHIKLADFGLSKDNVESKTRSFCGSPAYLSPQMLTDKEVGKEADLYGIGCVLYECLVGYPPYYSEDVPELYKNIRQAKLRFPKSVSEQAKSLISGLLQRDPKKRLGSKDFSQIFNHSFFSGINWDDITNKRITPPKRLTYESDDDQNSQDDEESKMIKSSHKNNFTDQDYVQDNKKMNRLINFSFVRSQQQT